MLAATCIFKIPTNNVLVLNLLISSIRLLTTLNLGYFANCSRFCGSPFILVCCICVVRSCSPPVGFLVVPVSVPNSSFVLMFSGFVTKLSKIWWLLRRTPFSRSAWLSSQDCYLSLLENRHFRCFVRSAAVADNRTVYVLKTGCFLWERVCSRLSQPQHSCAHCRFR